MQDRLSQGFLLRRTEAKGAITEAFAIVERFRNRHDQLNHFGVSRVRPVPHVHGRPPEELGKRPQRFDSAR
jgi:hypothetical protein